MVLMYQISVASGPRLAMFPEPNPHLPFIHQRLCVGRAVGTLCTEAQW